MAHILKYLLSLLLTMFMPKHFILIANTHIVIQCHHNPNISHVFMQLDLRLHSCTLGRRSLNPPGSPSLTQAMFAAATMENRNATILVLVQSLVP